MKKVLVIIFFLSILTPLSSQIMWQFKKDTLITWHYSGGDEFNGDKIDEVKWNYSYGWARSIFTNKEQQYYTEGHNHKVKNGQLSIQAIRKDTVAKTVDYMKDSDSLIDNKRFFGLNKKTFAFTSGMIQSKETFSHGYFECRLKIPKQKGYWPAFWLFSGDPYEEIDIFEGKSERTSQVHIDTHCRGCDKISYYLSKRSYGGWAKTRADLSGEFNILSCEWTNDYVRYYLNGQFIGNSNVNFKNPKNIIFNLAIPADDGPFHPGPVKKDTGKVAFEIDYLRIWDKSPSHQKKNPELIQRHGTYIANETNFIDKKFNKRKNKLVYGKKSAAKNEGIFISFFNDPGQLQFTVLGSFGKQFPLLEILDEENKILESKLLTQTIVNINSWPFKQKSVTIKISYQNKVASSVIAIP
ncbi:MAG: glycoside hydrolase family 16 protein [Sphingobacteriaceae bacterium]|nr:glycoside hydrolase family 16 protein [Sphingobacteriaceae bacterium]